MNPKFKKPAKILGISAGVLVLGVAGFYAAAISQLDNKRYEQELLAAMKAYSGQDATIEGGVHVSVFPTPVMITGKITVRESSDDALSPVFSAEKLQVDIALLSVFAGHITPSNIILTHPTLSLSGAENAHVNWGWIGTDLLKSLSPQGGKPAVPIAINDGTINYRNLAGDQSLTLDKLYAGGVVGARFALNGSVQNAVQSLHFSANTDKTDVPIAEGAFPFNMSLAANDKNILNIRSSMDLASGNAKMLGTFSVDTDDVQRWLRVPAPQAAKKNDGTEAAAKPAALPLSLAGKWELSDYVVKMSEVKWKGIGAEGSGDLSVNFQGVHPAIGANMDFATLDYLGWQQLAQAVFYVPPPEQKQLETFDTPTPHRENPLDRDYSIAANVRVQKLFAGKEEWGKATLDTDLDGGAITINQCNISLLGEGALSLFGVISQGGKGELRFEGSAEAQGKSLRQALGMIDPSARDLPDIGFGEFALRSNLFVSAEQIRFSEADATLEGMRFNGALIGYLGATPRMEAKINMKDVNFDFVRDAMRAKAAGVHASDKATQILDNTFKFGWLKDLHTRLDAKVLVDGFTFMEQKGESASFSLYAYDGDFRLYDMQLKYANRASDINLGLNVKGEFPAVKLQLNTDVVNTDYFRIAPEKTVSAEPQKDRADLDDKIDFRWMDGWNGVFDISLGKLVHGDLTLHNIKLQSRLENRQLAIQKLAFVYSRAASVVAGTLYGGKVPGMAINFSMVNADLRELIESLTGLTNISGNSNLSGTISASGLNWRAWLEQMDAKLLLSGRGVKVQGVNVAGVNQVVSVARSSADVFNNVSKVITGGVTDFSVDGSMNISGGELRMPGIALKSGLVSGKLVGAIKLVPMTMQFSTELNFANLSSDPIPNLIVQLSGPLAKPEMNVDTSSLEAFVAKRMVGK